MFTFSRDERGGQGSLCGLGAMYIALENTVSSKSELTTHDYTSMRKHLFITMNETESDVSDKELLEKYFKGKKKKNFIKTHIMT